MMAAATLLMLVTSWERKQRLLRGETDRLPVAGSVGVVGGAIRGSGEGNVLGLRTRAVGFDEPSGSGRVTIELASAGSHLDSKLMSTLEPLMIVL